jgi:O-antigen ligase
LRLPLGRQIKIGLVSVVLLAGLAGFFWKYAGFFHKGATSVVARFDYWEAGVRTATEHPILGTGPGTFSIPYQRIKRPESEMARLVHNDYLEQASDSGWFGFVAYTALIAGGLFWTFRRTFNPGATSSRDSGEMTLTFAVWLGVLGWGLQGLVDFPLYIPALAWPAFAFLGWLLGRESVLNTAQAGA